MSNETALLPLEHLKSGLALSSHTGCTLRCPYCLLFADGSLNAEVVPLATAGELVGLLNRPDALFLNGMTPIFVNNRTDPFLPQVREETIRILEAFVAAGVRSPVVLISKFFPPVSLKEFCRRLPLMFILSYSGLPEDFNFGILQKLDGIDRVVPAQNRFHYMRPIIPKKNDDPGVLTETLCRFADAGFSGSILSGLRITESNCRYAGFEKSDAGAHKRFDSDLFESVLASDKIRDRQYPLYRHTSCAIDAFMERPNRLRYFNRPGHCSRYCGNRVNCGQRSPDLQEICAQLSERFPEMEFSGEGNAIRIRSEVSQEITAFIKNAFGVPVQADRLTLSPSEEVLSGG